MSAEQLSLWDRPSGSEMVRALARLAYDGRRSPESAIQALADALPERPVEEIRRLWHSAWWHGHPSPPPMSRHLARWTPRRRRTSPHVAGGSP